MLNNIVMKTELNYESPEVTLLEVHSEGTIMSWSAIENLEENEGDWGW